MKFLGWIATCDDCGIEAMEKGGTVGEAIDNAVRHGFVRHPGTGKMYCEVHALERELVEA